MFSDKVSKINQDNWSQSRTLCITDEQLYNISGTSNKRNIPIEIIDGISRNLQNTKRREEFTVHVRSQYDYRFISAK